MAAQLPRKTHHLGRFGALQTQGARSVGEGSVDGSGEGVVGRRLGSGMGRGVGEDKR